jgi:hypothetical protein
MSVRTSPLRKSPHRELAFLGALVLWVGVAAVQGVGFVVGVAVGISIVSGYLTLRLIHALERLAAATERLAAENDELSDSVRSWPWPL